MRSISCPAPRLAPLLLATLLYGCSHDIVKGPPESQPDSATDTGTSPAEDIQVVLSEYVGTVVIVTWTTAEPTTGFVRFGESTSYALSTPEETEPATEHRALLLGLPTDTEAHLQVVTHPAAGAEHVSSDYTITTGSLPPEVPTITVTGEVVSWVGSYQILPMQGTGTTVVIIDDQGRVVWFDLLEPGNNLMRALQSHDGTHMIYCLAGPQDRLDLGSVMTVSMDGSDRIILPFPNIDHDLAELPDGTLAAIVVSTNTEFRGAGNTIVEMALDGTTTEVWSAWDDPALFASFQENMNWMHANALDYVLSDSGEESYYISSKEIGTITKVDRLSGQSVWHLNGDANEFELLNGTELGLESHQFQILDGGILMFDNGLPERLYSQAMEFAIDDVAMTAEEVWRYEHDPAMEVAAKGDVERFSDGNTQIVWSTGGELQNVDPAGQVHWQFNTELGYAITFVDRMESLYGH